MVTALRQSHVVRGLTVLYATSLLSGVGWSMMLPTIPVLSSHFDVSGGAAAQVVTVFGIGRFAGMPISGVMVDRFGTRTALVGGPILAASAAAAAFVTPWFPIILLAMLFVGMGDSIWTMGREVAGIDLTKLDQRGRVLSGFHGVHSGGLAIGPLIGGILTDQISFRAVFIVYVAMALGAMFLGLIAHDARPHRTSTAGAEIARHWLISFLRWPMGIPALFRQIEPHLRATYASLVFATLTSFMFRMTVQSMLPLYAGIRLGFTPTEVGVLFSISAALVISMILPAGFIIDKVGRKWATVPSTGFPAIAFVLIPFSDSFIQIAALMSIVGVANGLSLGSLATSTYDVIPASARGRLQALRRTVAEVGGIGGPLIGGLLANAFNPGVPFLVYAPILVLAAILLLVFAKETLVKHSH
jgi:MFS family permease